MFDDIITSKTRIKVLNSYLEEPTAMYHVREVVRRVDEEINAVRRELIHLEKKGILKKEPRANRVYYYLNDSYPFYDDLLRIYVKSHGLGAAVVKNRIKLGKIKYAMLTGSFAKDKKQDGGDVQIDILVVGTVVLPELNLLIKEEEAKRRREINYTVMSEDEFDFRKKRRDPFIAQVVSGGRIMLIGDEESLLA